MPAFYLCGLLLNCSAGALQQNAVISGIISVAASSVPPSRILLHLLHGHELRNPLLTCALALSLFAACLCVYIRVIIHRCRLQPSHLIIFLLLIVGESYQSREHGPNRARIPSHNNFVSLSSFLFGLLFYTSPPLLLLLLFFRVFSFFQLGFVRLLRVLNTHTHTQIGKWNVCYKKRNSTNWFNASGNDVVRFCDTIQYFFRLFWGGFCF